MRLIITLIRAFIIGMVCGPVLLACAVFARPLRDFARFARYIVHSMANAYHWVMAPVTPMRRITNRTSSFDGEPNYDHTYPR